MKKSNIANHTNKHSRNSCVFSTVIIVGVVYGGGMKKIKASCYYCEFYSQGFCFINPPYASGFPKTKKTNVCSKFNLCETLVLNNMWEFDINKNHSKKNNDD